MRQLLSDILIFGLSSLVAVGYVNATDATSEIQFNRDVRPILADKCFACHGRDAKRREADLRLDNADGAFKDQDGVRAVVPRNLEASELWNRINSLDEDSRMPPPETHKQITESEKEVLKRWIEQGAAYQKHWSFEPPSAPTIPPLTETDLNPVDAFVAARLHREGLERAVETDRATWIRRVAFTLTGLPPTPQEVDTYLADTGPDAAERVVDRYLASEHYGEEMARHWLDVARYADTHGLHLDNERQMWAYRDWVVQSFNRNQPFDEFTVDQLAGDLLPNPTTDQRIATGFNRCNVTTSEGGSIDAELIFRYAVDRASTTMQTWMGLTGGCAACHDHKFDPIAQREFYAFYAFFNSAADPAMDGNALLTQPVMKLESTRDKARLAELDQLISAQQKDLEQVLASLEYEDPGEDPTRSFTAWWTDASSRDLPDLPAEFKDIAKAGPAASSDPHIRERLRSHYLRLICETTKTQFTDRQKNLDALIHERDTLNSTIPGTFVFADLTEPRMSFVMNRGQYDKPGDPVEPAVPAVLPPLYRQDRSKRATRLDLARWLVSDEHPLTARVTVNRLWQQVFGIGLVKSSGDFGSQGEHPSHPELLDWLAVYFRKSGWDVKGLMRLLVSSATFRQSSQITPDALARDPENRLLARGPRLRLEAEQIRDNALSVSGLLDLRMGGPGVHPYQPINVWEPVGFAGSNTRFYQQDKGPALYRRSLYTFYKRTAPPPFMVNFDAPSREQSCTRRERSNTPLQALQLMNDLQHVEAARSLAERMLTVGGRQSSDRIAFSYKVVLGRAPSPVEQGVLENALAQLLQRYKNQPADAAKLIAHGESKVREGLDSVELAAYTLIASTILNLDETLTRN
jgi:Protein of unknown function (DUF1553)/Protein of unknown function (DUF1549)/Planctomycete cytochrome C